MTVLVTREVYYLYVGCSLDMRDWQQRKRGGFAMSDACCKHATTAVETDSGDKLYRCDEHRGIVSIITGPVWETVQVQESP